MQFKQLRNPATATAALPLLSLADFVGDNIAVRVSGRMRIQTSFGARVANVADLVLEDGKGYTGLIFAGFVKLMDLGEWYAGKLGLIEPAEGDADAMRQWTLDALTDAAGKKLSAAVDGYVKKFGTRGPEAWTAFSIEQGKKSEKKAARK